MLYEYALDPLLLSDIRNCQSVFDSFKPERGRVVSDVPRKWIREAFQAIQSIPDDQCAPVMRKTIKTHLQKLLQESLCENRRSTNWERARETWLEHVAKQNKAYPFAAVISNSIVKEPVNTYALQELFINTPNCWNVPVPVFVKRNAKDIVDALMPLLCISTQIILIDRHIYPNERKYRNVLLELIKRSALYNFGNGINKLAFHSMDHRLDMQKSLERNLLPHLPAGYQVVCCQWPKSLEHDRFVLTDVGGISFGEGLDEGSHDGTDDVRLSLISDTARKNLISKFNGVPTFRSEVSK